MQTIKNYWNKLLPLAKYTDEKYDRFKPIVAATFAGKRIFICFSNVLESYTLTPSLLRKILYISYFFSAFKRNIS